MAKRLESIRSGIEYQDLVAAEAALEMVDEHESPPIWVSFRNIDSSIENLRDELLEREMFDTLWHANVVIESRRVSENEATI